jgi:DNA-binding CsgD family transcriptional regulator
MLACNAAADLWDDEALHSLVTRWARTARDAGAVTALARALVFQGTLQEAIAGRFDAGEELIRQSNELFDAIGNPHAGRRSDAGRLFVAAWRGHEDDTRQLAEATLQGAMTRGIGGQVAFVNHALAVLEVGLGRYEAAMAVAQEACTGTAVYAATWTYPELVEAAIHAGRPDVAEGALAQLESTVLPSSTDWGLGMLARCQALTAKKDDAEDLFVMSIDRLQRSFAAPQLARSRLLYGEWLRRGRKRRAAREQLRAAHQSFASMGAVAFAARAKAELVATGEHLRQGALAMDVLTPHELRIAKLAAGGATNPEIGEHLFISPRTVEYHLHKVFRKLSINSRAHLPAGLLEASRTSSTEPG